MKLNVLHLFGKMSRGGAELRTLDLMPELYRRGIVFNFCSLSGEKGELDEQIVKMGGRVYYCPIRPRIGFSKRFSQLLKSVHFDVVHGHIHYSTGPALRIAHRCGVPGRIAHFRSVTDNQLQSPLRSIYRSYARRLCERHANAILSVSMAAMVSAWGEQWSQDPRAKVIYNGLNPARFREIPRDRRWLIEEIGLDTDSKIVLQVGNLHYAKGHDLSIAAMAELVKLEPRAHLVLAGEGVLRREIELDIQQRAIGSHVTLLGNRNDIPQLFRAADCAILPSRWEGLPGVALESIAAQTPMVAVDMPCVREISDLSGLIHPVKREPVLFAQTIQRVLNQGPGEGRAELPDAFDLQHCIDQFEDVYRKITS